MFGGTGVSPVRTGGTPVPPINRGVTELTSPLAPRSTPLFSRLYQICGRVVSVGQISSLPLPIAQSTLADSN